jgi:hypothetical protein
VLSGLGWCVLARRVATTRLPMSGNGVIWMIVSSVPRFGWSLASARAGWRRWLIAALVASLVSVPIAAAATAALRPTGGSRAAGSSG